ncbi:hypothetical protein GC101_34100 [Paenibacillus sp. LMG 31459]|uniref:Glycosyl hydrolase family 98 putative carbohydrate-binding module domain-containing protein n=1 Tax=Paenibacillus phytohabitans TaxID=2654978 RepID=A0ABX1YUH6_9BACL|nr:hypothetical protein [Paenibacillus phytohabitans]NOU83889.1 hypothetical protein [Paenibacillus phytohabitans]
MKVTPNDFENLTLIDRTTTMFQTYNAKLRFLGEAYVGKKIKLAFSITGVTSRIGFGYKAILSDGSYASNVSANISYFDPGEVRYYPDKTVYIITIDNPKNAKLFRLQYALGVELESSDNADTFKTIPITTTTKKIFLPAIKGIPYYSLKTNMTKSNEKSTVTITNVRMVKSEKPLAASQSFSLTNGPSSNIAYVFTIQAKTTFKQDEGAYEPWGAVEIPNKWNASFQGSKESLFRSDFPIRTFAGLSRNDTFTFNLPKSLVHTTSPANVSINGHEFLIDLKTGKAMDKPAPKYPNLTINPTLDIKTGIDGIGRVNRFDLGLSYDRDYNDPDKYYCYDFHYGLGGLYNTAKFNLSRNFDETISLHDGVLNFYSKNPEIDTDIHSMTSTIPQANLIKSIVITKDMQPQDIVINVKGVKTLYFAYFGKLDANGSANLAMNDFLLE